MQVTPCFTPGTLIATDRGARPVEELRRGDRVVTRDNGLKRITWTGRRSFGYRDILEAEELRPVLIRAGALGGGFPDRDMVVSPGHRFLVTPRQRLFTQVREETLVAAGALVGRPGIERARCLGVSYLHILMNQHEVVLADGAWTESFHPDDRIVRALAPKERQEILILFPEIATMGAALRFPAAREIQRSRFDA